MYVFICKFCVWYNVCKEIIMQTATQTKTKQTNNIRLEQSYPVQTKE